MDDFVCDRIFARAFPDPELLQDVILGRWIIHPGKENSVYHNSIPSADGDFLVPDSAGNWRISADGQPARSGSFRRSQLISQLDRKSLQGVGHLLQDIIDKGRGWEGWLDVSPIAPEMDDKLNFKPLEEKIEKLFGHLKEVCSRPRAYLLHEIEPVHIHKARRLPTRAISHLASHTEDWETRQLIRGGVIPKRILSEVREEDFDIYENRVAVRLVDNLSSYLTERIQEVKKVIKLFEDKQNYEVNGCHLLRNRIFELWGKAVTEDDQLGGAINTLEKLEALNYKVKGLMDSDLYRKVPRMVRVDPSLKMTNILANDQHYRRVAELWNDWVRAGLKEAESPEKFYVESQQVIRSLDSFLHLLVMKAFHQLGYKPRDSGAVIKMGTTLVLEKKRLECSCEWDEEGRIKIIAGDDTITIVSVAMDFAMARNDSQLECVLGQFKDSFDPADGDLLIAYCSSDEPSSELSQEKLIYFDNIGNDPRLDMPVSLVPVSPWDISSVERIASSLKWFLEKRRFADYPRKVRVDPNCLGFVEKRSIPAGIILKDQELVVERPVPDSDWKSCGLSRQLEQLASDLKNEKAALLQAKKFRGSPKKSSVSAKQRKIKQFELEAGQLNRLVGELGEALDWTKTLLDCPACGKTSVPALFEARDSGCFYCCCESCETSWELKACGSCGNDFGVILPGGKYPPDSIHSPVQGGKFFGSDILSPPVKDDLGGWKFLCTNPNCGSIS
jgi:hypothetical protein